MTFTREETLARREKARKAGLDREICKHIFPVAAAMVGVCLTAIGLLRIVSAVGRKGTVADDILSFDAVLFLLATLAAYFALRVESDPRRHSLERIADISFILAMVTLTAACFLVTYVVSV
jgi:hypothetical protein